MNAQEIRDYVVGLMKEDTRVLLVVTPSDLGMADSGNRIIARFHSGEQIVFNVALPRTRNAGNGDNETVEIQEDTD